MSGTTAFHVTHRSFDRQSLFASNSDYDIYLQLAGQYCMSCEVRVLGWCFLPCAAHWVVVPADESVLAEAFGRIRSHFALRSIERRGALGAHVWQSRFFFNPLPVSQIWEAVRFVEQSPFRAQIEKEPSNYAWSTASAHTGNSGVPDLLDMKEWEHRFTFSEWRDLLLHDHASDSLADSDVFLPSSATPPEQPQSSR